MNVTFVTESLNQYRSGWFEYLAALQEPNVSVLFMRVERDRPWDSQLSAPFPAVRIPSQNIPLRGYGTVTFLRSLNRCLTRSRPDFVVLPGWGQAASYQVARWCLRNRVPYGVLFETWTPQKVLSLPTRLTDHFRQWILVRSHLRLPVGQRAMEYAQSLGLDANVVHSNVCDVEGAARHIKQRVPVGERDFTVLYCGRLLETKGVHLVLQTALLCTHDRIRFVIMGSGPLEPEVRKLVDEHRAIEYLGSVAGAERFSVMAQVDVLLLPSLVEPWGVVVQEALAVGTPVVVSANVGCIPEFVEGFQTGTVTDTDAVAIRLALLELRALTERDPALSERCIAAASRHTYASATRELVEALARVLENGKVEE